MKSITKTQLRKLFKAGIKLTNTTGISTKIFEADIDCAKNIVFNGVKGAFKSGIDHFSFEVI